MTDTATAGLLAVPCPNDPGVTTALRCSRCEQPICPRCLVQTPVGARCKTCANVRKLPTFQVSARDYLKASGAALGAAIVGGAVWAVISRVPGAGFIGFILAFFLGYGVGELISRAVNRKRSIALQVIAGVAVVLALAISAALPALIVAFPDPVRMLSFVIGALLSLVVNPFAWISIVIGVAGAVLRFRN